MKKNIKTVIQTIFFTLCLMTLLSSCGKEEKIEEKKIVYKKIEVTLSDGIVPTKATFNGNDVYYVSGNEAGEKISTYDIEKKTENELPITFPNGTKTLAIHYSNNDTLIILTHQTQNEKNTFYLSAYEKGGIELWKNDITDSLKDNDLDTAFNLKTDKNGNIYLLDGLYYMCVWSEKGQFQFSLRNEKWLNGISCVDGEIWVWAQDSENNYLQKIDIGKQKWEEIKCKNLPSVSGFNGCIFNEHTEGHILINSGSSLSSYNLKKGTTEKILDWTEHGLLAENIYEWSKQGEKFFCIAADGENIKFIELVPDSKGEGSQKQIITINDDGTHGFIEHAISKFNQHNEKYIVQLVENEGNAVQSIALRNAEILAGNGTDIICMPSEEQYRNYANKGILEDLYAYLDNDSEIKRKDYLSNIYTTYEQNEKLYGIPPSFVIYTTMAPTKYVGENMGVTIEEFKKITEDLPEGMKLNPFFINKELTFNILLPYTYTQFIDFEHHTCNFESDEFISWITFINSIKLEETFDTVGEFDPTKININDYLLLPGIVSPGTSHQGNKLLFNNNEISYLGYPGENDCGSYIGNATAVGIWSQSSNKEGAWEFIKFLLSEEQQNSLSEQESTEFPVKIASMEEIFSEAMEPVYEIDENGNQTEIPKGETALFSGEKVPYYAATTDDIKKIRDLATSVNMIYNGYFNKAIDKIVMEEVAAFYNGDKTAEEVASLIQNRVELYLNETK